MSSRVSSTIGFNEIRPLPTCSGVNLIVMLQVCASEELCHERTSSCGAAAIMTAGVILQCGAGWQQIMLIMHVAPISLHHMLQVIMSSLLDMMMLGVVFARFSAPTKRATSVQFTSKVVLHRHTSGFWSLSFRYVVFNSLSDQCAQHLGCQQHPLLSRACGRLDACLTAS